MNPVQQALEASLAHLRDQAEGYPCCICPDGCQGVDGDPACSVYCSICIHGCPAVTPESCCRERVVSDQADPGLPEEDTPELVEYGRYAGQVVDGPKIRLGNRWEPTWWVHDTQPGVWVLIEYQWLDGARRMVCGCPEGQAVIEAFEDGRPVDSCWHLRAVMEELHRRQAPSRSRPQAPVNSGMWE